MGKAFSEKERSLLQQKLRETGLRLFAEKGIKGVSIRELTSAAGIAQGGFYTFYKDKTDFITDLVELRVREKLAKMAENKETSLADPVEFLSGQFYAEGMHLKENKAFDNALSGTMELFFGIDKNAADRIKSLYSEYIGMLIQYWRDNGYAVEADTDGLLSMIRMCAIMVINSSLMDEGYYRQIYRTFCYAQVREFIKVSR